MSVGGKNPIMELIKRPMARAARWRAEGTEGPRGVSGTEHSPEQFRGFSAFLKGEDDPDAAQPEIGRGGAAARFTVSMVPNIARSMRGIVRAAYGLRNNPPRPRRKIEPHELDELEGLALLHGADLIGYTQIDPDHVFAGCRVLDRNVIVLGMEMNQADMAKAPHFDAEHEVHRVYADLGDVTLQVAQYLRRRGFAAEAGPALGGDAVYPPIAQAAGLGRVGRNGLLLTEAFGPRLRLAVVYCSVDDLPFHRDPGAHEWMRQFCDMCGACVRRCPPGAIHTQPVLRANGAPTYVDNESCFPFFRANHGCGVCIKVCPFSHVPVEKLRTAFERRHESERHQARLETIMRTPERVRLRVVEDAGSPTATEGSRDAS